MSFLDRRGLWCRPHVLNPSSLFLKSYVWFLHPFESNHCVARFSPLGHCFIIALFYCVLHLLSQLLLSNLPSMLALPNYRCFIVVLHTYENPGNFQRGWGSAQPAPLLLKIDNRCRAQLSNQFRSKKHLTATCLVIRWQR